MAQHPLVGVWRVKTKGAPFGYHMFVFHSDGTMQQANPAEGNKDTSDTPGLGVWGERGGQLKARFEEYRVDYKTGAITRGVIDCVLELSGSELKGRCSFNIYNPDNGTLVQGPYSATLRGERVMLD